MRFSIYFTHPQHAQLTALGSQWLGRSAFSNEPLSQPAINGITQERFFQLTRDARRYGFHATMKPPFQLAAGKTQEHALAALEAFAARTAPVQLAGLAPSFIGKFLALTPIEPSQQLNELAAHCIREFDHLRAPLNNEDIARRRQAPLTPKQDSYLLDWGYPYIFDEFHFHMTLSKRLEDETERDALKRAADAFFAPVLNAPVTLSHLALCMEPEAGASFKIIATRPLEGTAG